MMVWWTFLVLPVAFQYACVAVTAVAFGSFVTTLAHRVPLMLWAGLDVHPSGDGTAQVGASENVWRECRCPHCHEKIAARHNLPIFGYVVLGGRCAHCSSPIGRQYVLLEVGALVAGVLLFAKFGPTTRFAGAFFFCWTLMVLAAIDANHMLLPDMFTLPLLWAGLLVASLDHGVSASSAILGAAGGYALLRVISALNEVVTGFGMGEGDMKMFAAMAAWLGWQAIPQLLLISGLLSVMVSAMKGISGRGSFTEPKPFGPWLAVAGITTMYVGDLLPMFYR
jgi:leader peptidase (prepilin peptidase)/N-methyltransferase